MKVKILILVLCCIVIINSVCASSFEIYPVLDTGQVSEESVNLVDLPHDIPSMVSINVVDTPLICTDKNGQIIECPEAQGSSQPKTIIMQLYPEVNLSIADMGDTVMQTRVTGEPKIEIYYGYQFDESHPWSHYYRVDGDRVVKADFDTRTVTVGVVDPDVVNTILANNEADGSIPAWEEL